MFSRYIERDIIRIERENGGEAYSFLVSWHLERNHVEINYGGSKRVRKYLYMKLASISVEFLK